MYYYINIIDSVCFTEIFKLDEKDIEKFNELEIKNEIGTVLRHEIDDNIHRIIIKSASDQLLKLINVISYYVIIIGSDGFAKIFELDKKDIEKFDELENKGKLGKMLEHKIDDNVHIIYIECVSDELKQLMRI